MRYERAELVACAFGLDALAAASAALGFWLLFVISGLLLVACVTRWEALGDGPGAGAQ